MKRIIPILFASLCLPTFSFAAEDKPAEAKPAAEGAPAIKVVEMNDLEKKFERTMSGATLIGRFTTHGKDDQLPKEDKYAISKVTKIGDDLWLFTAKQLPIPFPIPVKWAGDTPVISMTKLTIPTVGTFTVRLMIYDDHYAGTWDAGDHGGHMWGRIERADKDGDAAPAEKPPASEKPNE